MHTVEDAYRSASKLYWIAFLLTARAELSFNLILEALDSEGGFDLICLSEKLPDLRSIIVKKALGAIRGELTASAQQSAQQASDLTVMPASGWSVGPDISQAQLEEAFFTLNLFSRCALLLTVFEGFCVDEVAKLLHSAPEQVRRGRETGLYQLSRSLRSVASKG